MWIASAAPERTDWSQFSLGRRASDCVPLAAEYIPKDRAELSISVQYFNVAYRQPSANTSTHVFLVLPSYLFFVCFWFCFTLCCATVCAAILQDFRFIFSFPFRIEIGKMAMMWRLFVCFATLSSCRGIFIGGEQDVGSPLRVAQCRATCLERVSTPPLLPRLHAEL